MLFSILAQPRTGSTWLQRTLDSREDCRCFLELRHPYVKQAGPKAGRFRYWLDSHTTGECPNVGTKEIVTHLSDQDLYELQQVDRRLITVRHPLAMFVSRRQAEAGGVWNRYQDGSDMYGVDPLRRAYSYDPVQAGVDDYLDFYRAWEEQERRKTDTGVYVVRYEDILYEPDKVWSDVQDWLGLEPRDITDSTVRLHPEPMSERLPGFDRLLALHGTVLPVCRLRPV